MEEKLIICFICWSVINMALTNKNSGKKWGKDDLKKLSELIKKNTPTRVISFKIGRTENAIYGKASEIKKSLKPTNQSPYNRKK